MPEESNDNFGLTSLGIPATAYQDTRSAEQLVTDRLVTARQISTLSTPDGDERIREILEQLRWAQETSTDPGRVPFDIWWTDPAVAPPVLTQRGALIIEDDTAENDAALGRGRELPVTGYELVREDERDARFVRAEAPRPADEPTARLYRAVSPKSRQQVVADAKTLRRNNIPASPLYTIPLGHIVKGDDFPEPTQPQRQLPQLPLPASGARVRVAVIDTGIAEKPREHDKRLNGVPRETGNIDPLDTMPQHGRLDWFAGHGTFVAGVVEQVAPAADIRVYRFTSGDGIGTEQGVADALRRAVLEAAAEAAENGEELRLVVNLSLGTAALSGIPPLALQDAVEWVEREHPGVVIVAAAGNNGTGDLMYPAAFPQVKAVAALNADLTPAAFSSYGPWVDFACVGAGIVSTFVEGLLPPATPRPPVVDLVFEEESYSIWSGTSFAAPQIAGLIAQVAMTKNCTPAEACDLVRNAGSSRQNYGVTLKVLPGTHAEGGQP